MIVIFFELYLISFIFQLLFGLISREQTKSNTKVHVISSILDPLVSRFSVVALVVLLKLYISPQSDVPPIFKEIFPTNLLLESLRGKRYLQFWDWNIIYPGVNGTNQFLEELSSRTKTTSQGKRLTKHTILSFLSLHLFTSKNFIDFIF
jgi:hypothetical protein